MTVEENLLMGGYIKDKQDEAYEEAERIFQKYERLRNRRNQPAKVLSGGERRLLEISRALVMKPSVLLVDEPSIGLEPKYINMVFEILEDLQKAEKKTIILVEQNAKKGLEFADIGYEETETKGLGWISGKVSKIDNQNGKFKLPHIGWNQINITKESKLFGNIQNNSHMYFVHSYEFIPEDKNVISATTDYCSNIVCSVEKDNIFGTQFHPEKSDKMGLKIIDNFINL